MRLRERERERERDGRAVFLSRLAPSPTHFRHLCRIRTLRERERERQREKERESGRERERMAEIIPVIALPVKRTKLNIYIFGVFLSSGGAEGRGL